MADESERDWWSQWTTMSRALLRGYISRDKKNEIPSSVYFPEGHENEIKCRRALATLLSSGNPPKEILHLLANLFAPNDFEHAAERTLVFKFRRRGRRMDHLRRSAIAQKVSDAIETKGSVDAAIASVAKELGGPEDSNLKKEETVRKIWQAYKPFYDAGVI